MNKEFIKLSDDTVIVSDEKGHIITKTNSDDKLLVIENKIEKTLYEIYEIEAFIEFNNKGISFLKKLLVAQPFLFAGISSLLYMGALSSSVALNILISAVIVSPITICLGAKTKSLKKEIKQLHTRKDTAMDLLDEYKNEFYEKRSDFLCKKYDEKIVVNISDLKTEKVKTQETSSYIDEQLEKPKSLVKKR